MAKIVLEILADTSQVNPQLEKMAGNLTEVNSEAKKFTTETNKGFKEVASSAEKANKELANPSPTIEQKKQISAIQQLKNEIKAYESAAIKAGEGTAEFARNIALAGQKKADLNDLKQSIAALDPDNIAKGFLGLATSVSGGFAVAQGAIALTGSESENLQKALLKVQAAQAVLAGLQELANAKDEIGKVRLILLNKIQTKELAIQAAAMEAQIALTGAQSAEVIALGEAQQVQTAATGKLTIAQRILNIAMKANPIGIIISAIAAVAALTAAYLTQAAATESAARIEKIQSEALDGTIIKDKELRDSYNEHLIKLNELNNQYAVLNGTMTEHEAALDNIAAKNKLAVDTINKDTKVKLEEAGGFWNTLSKKALVGVGSLFVDVVDKNGKILSNEELASAEILGIKADEAAKLKSQQDKTNDEILAANLENDKKKKDASKKSYDDLLKNQKDFNQSSLDLAKRVRQGEIEAAKGTEKVQLQEAEALREIDLLKKTLIEKSVLAGKGDKLSLEQENQFAILKNQILLKSGQEQIDIEDATQKKIDEDKKAALEKKQAEAEKAFADELKRIEDHGKATVLLTKEGSVENLNAQIEDIKKVADFKKTQAGLSADEVIIIEQEANQKILALRKELSKKEGFSWAKLLGVTPEDLQKIKQSLGSILDSAKSIIDQQLQAEQDALDKRKSINDEIISNGDNRISELNDQLNTELELHKQGFASNVKAVKEALDFEMTQRGIALEEKKRIAEEEEQLKKKQVISDSVAQISNILTAGSTLFAKGAFAGPVGIVVAIATIASMVASFLALKAKLNAAGFKDGGFTGEIGESEVAGVVHGKEFVSTAKTTKKHRPLLEALHSENYSGLKFADIQPILEGAKFNIETLNQIDGEGKIYHQSKNIHAEKMVSLMGATNKNLNKFFEHVKNKPSQIINPDGSVTIKSGNSSRTIKKQ